MLEALGNFFNLSADTFYIQIYRHYFLVTNLETKQQLKIERSPDSIHPRLVMANFIQALNELKPAIKKLKTATLKKPLMLIHPLEMTEGGITSVELCSYSDLAKELGAEKMAVAHYADPMGYEDLSAFFSEFK